MDILAAIAPVGPTAQAEAPETSGDVTTTAFAEALSLVQAPTASPVPAPLVAVNPEPVPASETPAPVLPQESTTPAAPLPSLAEAPVIEDVAPLADEAEPTEPPSQTDDQPKRDDIAEQPKDPLDAIRQRLDLIDNAGQLAYAALVVPVQAPQSAPAPVAPEADDSYTGPSSTAVEWSPPEADSPEIETSPVETRVAEVVEAVEQPLHPTTRSRLEAPSTDTTPTVPTGLAAISTSVASNPISFDDSPQPTPALGSSAWQEDLGQQVVAMVRRGDQQVDMQLNPADLGPLSISLNVGDSGVQAQFQSLHASVRAAVEQALPQLQVALASQGLTLGEASVNDGASRQASGEQPRRESPGGGSRQPRATAATEVVRAQPLAVGGMGVDLYL
ncbi:flagellar hook-length control protein FliK [Pseudomonas sp. 148P]|uniref:Flagellar hook-length control protein FliK n=1 Tax=Pseudomonas ulcerans TaxID=3115852 RepID=A0ABU7HJL3_9PSED|nr:MULTISPECIES: flagellar hook-length control protein FliK [unclassified Pseudomonas]MEE1921418.1 flagellar hook-length control protein FliK [Pseudomonas sp. 147P]MEE1931701.1 flagellar hook-length control protein FliK [Pseudomonas sp. 148P]